MNNQLKTPNDVLLDDMSKLLDLVIFSADGARSVEKIFDEAAKGECRGLDDALRLISLAHAAHSIAETKEVAGVTHGLHGGWYHDVGLRLLRRAADAVAAGMAVAELWETEARVH